MLLVALLVTFIIALNAVPQASSQSQENLQALSFQTFSGLAAVYKTGGQAPDLVAKLNDALRLMDEAQMQSVQGNNSAATSLADQSGSIMTEVLKETPSAAQLAASERTTTVIETIAIVPTVVLLSTLIFFLSLLVWRNYELRRLFEMRIIRVVRDEVKD